MAAAVLQHPLIGAVNGVKHANEDVVQYLGIQYATLEHRFASPELKTGYEGKVDATSYGSTVISSSMGCEIEFGLIQKRLEKPPVPANSDLGGLNLNITVPLNPADGEVDKLPVLLFIHGGGFLFGGTWAPHYEMARFVAFSGSIGKPVIGVSINYRLGVPGFLDSDELRAAGVSPNRGFLDQNAALQWVRQNIAGFGGDPDQVTALGQSAGGSSVMNLLNLPQADGPLFKRAVCLSGNPMAAALFPRNVANKAYDTVLECLGIRSDLSSEAKISALTETAAEDLLTKVPPSVPLGPVVDNDQLPSFKRMQTQPPLQHVPLMIGSTDFDGSIYEVLGVFAGRDEDSLGQDFVSNLKRVVPTSQHANVEKLLSLYGLSDRTGDPDETRRKILQVGNDLKYFATTQSYAASWPTESWTYYFQEANPWEGPHQGRSAHCLDIAYLFLNYEHVMNEAQLQVAKAFARDVVTFVHGEEPWSEFQSSRKIRVYGQGGKKQSPEDVTDEASVGPSPQVRELWDEIGLDTLNHAWDAYFSRQ